jgi:hypothetical protein
MNNNNNDKDLWKLKLLMIVGYWAIIIILVILGDYINKRYIYISLSLLINDITITIMGIIILVILGNHNNIGYHGLWYPIIISDYNIAIIHIDINNIYDIMRYYYHHIMTYHIYHGIYWVIIIILVKISVW